MFRPNLTCFVREQGGYDAYGMPIQGKKKKEPCAVVKKILINDKTSVRADSSASRGNARELEANTVILLSPTTIARIDSLIELHGDSFRIKSMHARFAISGRLDHYECECTYWRELGGA